MAIWQAIIFGLVQGITEFLPISSSGHLYLLSSILNINTENGEFMILSVFLHVCTLVPVVVVLWKEIIGLFSNKCKRLLYLIIATIPAVVVGLIYKLLGGDDMFGGSYIYVLGAFFMVTAIILLCIEYLAKKKIRNKEIDYKSATYMGIAQALGTLPGISRSGITLLGGTIAGANREENANFTFLMCIPVILGCAGIEGLDIIIKGSIGSLNIVPMLVAGVCAIVTGYLSVKVMLNVIKKANYKYFSAYLAVLSVVVIILKATNVL